MDSFCKIFLCLWAGIYTKSCCCGSHRHPSWVGRLYSSEHGNKVYARGPHHSREPDSAGGAKKYTCDLLGEPDSRDAQAGPESTIHSYTR